MKYLSFDAETDGLFGPVFAIGAVVIDHKKEIHDKFTGAYMEEPITNSWVRENCLPLSDDIPMYRSREELLDAFWSFYMKHQSNCIVLADTPFPVEAGLLRKCVERDMANRVQFSPFPVIDVASLFFANDMSNDINRMEFSGYNGVRHNPLDDAVASALCAIKLMNEKT